MDRRLIDTTLAVIGLLVIVYASVLALFSPVDFPKDMDDKRGFPYLLDKPVGEDAYYALTVAWNLAASGKMTYNHGEPTTGVQPLAVILYSAIAKAIQSVNGDKLVLVRVVLILNAVLLVVLGHLAGVIARVVTAAPIAERAYGLTFLLCVTSFWLFRLFTYGLETGILLVLFGGLILQDVGGGGRLSRSHALKVGLLAGLTGLARIDFGVPFACWLGVNLFRKRLTISDGFLAGLSALCLMSPWLLYVHRTSGGWVPSSGWAESVWIPQAGPTSLQRAWEMFWAMQANLALPVYLPGGDFLRLGALLFTCGFCWLGVTNYKGAAATLRSEPTRRLIGWAFSYVVLMVSYVAFSVATHFYARYAAPLALLASPVLGSLVATRRIAGSLRGWCIVVGGLVSLFTLWAVLSLHSGRIGNSHVVTAGFVKTYYGDVKVGAFQSGIVGFVNSNVYNLDGKVSSRALRALQRNEMARYLEDKGIRVLVDWPSYLRQHLRDVYLDPERHGWVRCQMQPGNASICLERVIRR